MSRLVLTLALALVATACAPATEPRTVIAAGPRVLFDDQLRGPALGGGHRPICRRATRTTASSSRTSRRPPRACSARCTRRCFRPACAYEITARLRKAHGKARSGSCSGAGAGPTTATFAHAFGSPRTFTYRVASWSGGKLELTLVPPTATGA